MAHKDRRTLQASSLSAPKAVNATAPADIGFLEIAWNFRRAIV
jgi:hypothetical protein